MIAKYKQKKKICRIARRNTRRITGKYVHIASKIISIVSYVKNILTSRVSNVKYVRKSPVSIAGKLPKMTATVHTSRLVIRLVLSVMDVVDFPPSSVMNVPTRNAMDQIAFAVIAEMREFNVGGLDKNQSPNSIIFLGQAKIIQVCNTAFRFSLHSDIIYGDTLLLLLAIHKSLLTQNYRVSHG